MIDVVEKGVDRLHPLDGAPLDEIPLGAVDNAGDQIEGNQPLGRTPFAIDRKGDAEPPENLLGGLLLGDEGLHGETVEQPGKGRKSGPDLAGLIAHLVEEFAGKQGGLLCPRLDTRPLNSLRQSRPSWLFTKRPTPKLGALPLSYFQAS